MLNALIRIVLYSAVAVLPLVLVNYTAIEAASFLQEVGKSFAMRFIHSIFRNQTESWHISCA